jgi:hypothetical protein
LGIPKRIILVFWALSGFSLQVLAPKLKMLQTGKSPDSYRDWSLCRFKHLKVSVLWAFRFNPGQGRSASNEILFTENYT